MKLLPNINIPEAPFARAPFTVRPAHIALGEKLLESGNMWYGVALLDEAGRMIGSMLRMDFASEEELRKWLALEPIVTGKVWESIEIHRCNVRDPWQFNRDREFFEATEQRNNN